MSHPSPSRDELAAQYLDRLPYDPYPVQEEALLAWFTEPQGVMVCAPTGTGKTLIAEAAMFEALSTGTRAYYTTPLIALTEQKFDELQQRAEQWGFDPLDVGLVTGNRRVNPDARCLVVVAEILLNRLLHRDAFDFDDVAAVVMDEFHSFNDPERGMVWELTLGLLPPHVRTLLLSATVGNAVEFAGWLHRAHGRNLALVQSQDRKVPLTYHWVGDRLLGELVEEMAEGEGDNRRTPALIFCFNREECWNVAEQLKGKGLLAAEQRKRLLDLLPQYDWSEGAGPKLRQILQRGVGVHHAGVLPKYRRIVEELFQQKLLSVCVCTETLSAGINLPARSVVVPTLMKGPPDKQKLIYPSTAHQIFGRAGRPQFDTVGYVFVLAHEDDVKLLRWRQQYERIPDDVKDPNLRKAKKALERKKPKRRTNQQYWTQQQFEKLVAAPPGRLQSRGYVPWRLLAYLLDASPEIEPIRALVAKRLMEPRRIDDGLRQLDRMLMVLWRAGYVELEPRPLPPRTAAQPDRRPDAISPAAPRDEEDAPPRDDDDDAGAADAPPALTAADLTLGGASLAEAPSTSRPQDAARSAPPAAKGDAASSVPPDEPAYRPLRAYPTELMARLKSFRSVNPLYGVFLVNQLGIADRNERIQAMESVLEMPGSVAHFVRVPPQDVLPPGPLATTRLDVSLLQLGLATEDELRASAEEPQERHRGPFAEERKRVLTLADKLRLQFDFDFPGVHDVYTQPVWAAGELLLLGGDFNKYVTAIRFQKQEGIVFRHLLRLILLIGEFLQLCPADADPEEWREDLTDISEQITASCRAVDPTSTEKVLEQIQVRASLEAEGETVL